MCAQSHNDAKPFQVHSALGGIGCKFITSSIGWLLIFSHVNYVCANRDKCQQKPWGSKEQVFGGCTMNMSAQYHHYTSRSGHILNVGPSYVAFRHWSVFLDEFEIYTL